MAQSNVSRMLKSLERLLGTTLFLRSNSRVRETEAGVLLAPRLAYINVLVNDAAQRAAQQIPGHDTERRVLRFVLGLSARRYEQLLGLQEVRSIAAAAKKLKISADAVRKILRESQRQLPGPLFDRPEGGRLTATVFGALLLSRMRVLQREIAHAATDVAAIHGPNRGTLTVGCLPSTAAWLTPMAVVALLAAHPHIHVRIAEGTYDELVLNLQSGYLDLIVGGLQPAAAFPDLQLDPLYDDQLRVFARSRHPLAGRKRPSPSALSRCRWVVPTRGPIAEPVLEMLLTSAGIRPTLPSIQCASIVAIAGLLQSADLLTVGASSQFRHEVNDGQLVELDCDLLSEPWACGMIRRADAPPSVAMKLFRDALRIGINRRNRSTRSMHKIDKSA
jgi:LysR family transcriptional regulator of gallate degradation